MPPTKRNAAARSGNSRSPEIKRQRREQSPVTETYPVPDRLQDYIEAFADRRSSFVLRFSIDDLDAVHRLAWGLDSRADSIIVNLEFVQGERKSSGHARFCVHSSTDREKRRHQYSSTIQDVEQCIQTPCSPRSTILTCVLSRELFGLLGLRGCRDLGIIYDRVSELIKSDPTRRCLICGTYYDVKVYTPTACLPECLKILDKWPLRARLSHLLSDTEVLDFLLCCIYTGVNGQQRFPGHYGKDSSLLVGCPLRLQDIQPAIDSLSRLSDDLGMQQLVNSKARHGSSRRQLLSWLTLRSRGCMASLTRDAEFFVQENGLESSHQFMLLNSRIERQAAFTKELAKVGVGSVAFHGARAPRAFNIVTDALCDMMSKPYVQNIPGQAGIFYSDSPQYSYDYTRGDVPLKAWKQSKFYGQDWSVLFGLEVALPWIPFRENEHSTSIESSLMIRFIFLIPQHNDVLECSLSMYPLQIDPEAMKKAYKVLGRGKLSSQHIGLGAKQAPNDQPAASEGHGHA